MSERALLPFPSTHWTIVALAGASDAARRQVLGRLLEHYLPAMRSYLVARFRVDADRADDLLQDFLCDKVLDQDIIRRADQARGKFRTFLVTALERFTVSQIRKGRAAKRSPVGGVGSLDAGEEGPVADPPAPARADVFDTAWARQVLHLAVVQTRAECDAGGRADLWAVFEGRVLLPTLREQEPTPLPELVARLGLMPAKVSNLLITSKRMFDRNLKAVVAAYAVDERDTEDEVRRLQHILARPGA